MKVSRIKETEPVRETETETDRETDRQTDRQRTPIYSNIHVLACVIEH